MHYTLTAQPEFDGMDEALVVIATVVTLRWVVHLQQDEASAGGHLMPWQRWAMVKMPHNRRPSREQGRQQLVRTHLNINI